MRGSSTKRVSSDNGLTIRILLIVQKPAGSQKGAQRVKEGTATATVQSGLPDQWWDCAMACTTRWPMSRGAEGSYKPTSSKDDARLQQFGKIMRTEVFTRSVSRASLACDRLRRLGKLVHLGSPHSEIRVSRSLTFISMCGRISHTVRSCSKWETLR